MTKFRHPSKKNNARSNSQNADRPKTADSKSENSDAEVAFDVSKMLEGRVSVATSIEALSTAYHAIDGRYREALLGFLGHIVAVAYFLHDDEDAWAEFCRADLWKDWPRSWRPKPQDTSAALVSVIRRVVGKEPHNSYRITKWKKVLQPLFEQRMRPDDIPGFIKENGGLEKLSRNPPRPDDQVPKDLDFNKDNLKFEVSGEDVRAKILSVAPGKRFLILARREEDENGESTVELVSARSPKKKTRNRAQQ